MVVIFRNPQIVNEIKVKPQNLNLSDTKIVNYKKVWLGTVYDETEWHRKEMKETEFIMRKLQGSELL